MVTVPTRSVAVVGGGQLGSRHLQGLVQCREILSIHVVDPDPDALGVAEERWFDAGGPRSGHTVEFHADSDGLPSHLDLVIVSTTAGARPSVVEYLGANATVGSWILEKVLAQSDLDLDRISTSVGESTPAWVNTWARTTPWFRELRGEVGPGPLVVEVEGSSWGMGCNAVHFVDLCAWWTGEELMEIDGAELDRCWPRAKRPGHHELSGRLRATFSAGTTVLLRSTPPMSGATAGSDAVDRMSIRTADDLWTVHQPFSESSGSAVSDSGVQIKGRIEYQSERTAPLVDSILTTGTCELPDLATSTGQHRLLLAGLLREKPRIEGIEPDRVPIT